MSDFCTRTKKVDKSQNTAYSIHDIFQIQFVRGVFIATNLGYNFSAIISL